MNTGIYLIGNPPVLAAFFSVTYASHEHICKKKHGNYDESLENCAVPSLRTPAVSVEGPQMFLKIYRFCLSPKVEDKRKQAYVDERSAITSVRMRKCQNRVVFCLLHARNVNF